MKDLRRITRSLKLLAIGLLPLTTCFAYYTFERIGDAGLSMVVPVALAFPIALIGFIGATALFASGRRSGLLLIAAVSAFLLPTAFIAVIWLIT